MWQNETDQDGALLDDTWVADITGLLDLSEWTEKSPGLRIIARDEPLHPKYTRGPVIGRKLAVGGIS